jgi:hypothetical protein
MISASFDGMALIEGFTRTILAPVENVRNRSTMLGSNVNGEAVKITSV